MKRLTFKEPNGKFGVIGMNDGNKEDKLYMCVYKLKDYEDSGLSPDDVDNLRYKIEDLTERAEKAEAALKESQERCDAAIEDIRLDDKCKVCAHGQNDIEGCDVECLDCKSEICVCRTCRDCDKWQWRGVLKKEALPDENHT